MAVEGWWPVTAVSRVGLPAAARNNDIAVCAYVYVEEKMKTVFKSMHNMILK